MTINNQLRMPLLLIALLAIIAVPIAAQSPNTSTIIVAVVDQAGAIVKDAKVMAVNTATGALREAVSGNDGSATIPALPLTGTYTVSVSKAYTVSVSKAYTVSVSKAYTVSVSKEGYGAQRRNPPP